MYQLFDWFARKISIKGQNPKNSLLSFSSINCKIKHASTLTNIDRKGHLWWLSIDAMWEGREYSKGRSSVIEKHPQHSKPSKEHGYMHHPSHPKVATRTPCLDAVASSVLHGVPGRGILHCLIEELNWGGRNIPWRVVRVTRKRYL